MNILVDTHCHLNHPDFVSDAAQVWEHARQKGVQYAIVVGYDLPSSRTALQIADRFTGCFASVGVHPHDASQFSSETLNQLSDLASHRRVVAIGEIGLDYYRNLSPKEAQMVTFEQQLHLASQFNLPVILHCRDAYDDLLDTLERYPLRGVLHCFGGEERHARRAVEMGWYLGIGGVVTFKNAHALREAVQQTPLEYLLLETDAPYLAPVPHRGERNEPAYLALIAQAVASLKNVPVEELAAVTTQNARDLFSMEERYQ